MLIRAVTQTDLGTRSGALAMNIGVLDLKSGKFRPLVQGLHGIYAPSGHLLYVTPTRSLVGVRFDQSRLEIVGQPHTITEDISVGRNGSVHIALAATGTLAYRRGGTDIVGGIREFVWVTRAGVATPVDPEWTGDFPSPASFSPDGKSIVATRSRPGGGQEIWIKKLDRGPAFKLLASDAVDPAWSPDGKTIAFGTSEGIWLLAADGSSRARIRVRTHWTPHRLHFTPDGRSILFDSDEDVFAVAVAGDTTLRQLVATAGNDRAPRLSPDGRWLSFSSSVVFGRTEVYVRDFREPDAAPVQVSTDGGYSQRWSWDGRELYYVDPRTNVIIAVPVESGPGLRLGTPVPLFNTSSFTGLFSGIPSFNPAPDGRFLFRRVVGGRERPAPDDLVVVQGFLDELKARRTP